MGGIAPISPATNKRNIAIRFAMIKKPRITVPYREMCMYALTNNPYRALMAREISRYIKQSVRFGLRNFNSGIRSTLFRLTKEGIVKRYVGPVGKFCYYLPEFPPDNLPTTIE